MAAWPVIAGCSPCSTFTDLFINLVHLNLHPLFLELHSVDIIANETSNRLNPSLVGFGPRNRYAGESAKSQETSNYKNTIGSLKRLVGRSFNEPEIQEYEKKFILPELCDVAGSVGVKVRILSPCT